MASAKAIKAVVFDLDDTLSDHDSSLLVSMQAVLGIAFRPQLLDNGKPWDFNVLMSAYKALVCRSISSIEADPDRTDPPHLAESCGFFVKSFFKVVGCEQAVSLYGEAANNMFAFAYLISSSAMPNARDTLIQLKNEGCAIGIISRQEQFRGRNILQALDLSRQQIDILVTAEEFEDDLHDCPDIFEYATHKLGFQPWDAAVVTRDEYWAKDASDALCNAIWYNPDDVSAPGTYTNERTGLMVIKDFQQLPQLLVSDTVLNQRASIDQEAEKQDWAGLTQRSSTPEHWSGSLLTSDDDTSDDDIFDST